MNEEREIDSNLFSSKELKRASDLNNGLIFIDVSWSYSTHPMITNKNFREIVLNFMLILNFYKKNKNLKMNKLVLTSIFSIVYSHYTREELNSLRDLKKKLRLEKNKFLN